MEHCGLLAPSATSPFGGSVTEQEKLVLVPHEPAFDQRQAGAEVLHEGDRLTGTVTMGAFGKAEMTGTRRG